MATLIPAGIDIPWEGLRNGAIMNDDGHGYAIASEKEGIEVFKSMKFEETEAALREARERHGKNSIVLFHSRFATHGTTNEYNVHPFWAVPRGETIDDSYTVMVHNGILPYKWQPKHGDKRSDTRIFVDEVTPDYLLTESGVPSRRGGKALGEMIGSGNKLVFLSVASGKPKARIINAHLGEQEGGVWYSNGGYLPSRWGWSGYRSSSSVFGGGGRYYSGGKVIDTTSVWDDEDLETASSSSYETPDTCDLCNSYGTIDAFTRMCNVCDFCIDCEMTGHDCTCYTPGMWSGTSQSPFDDDQSVAEFLSSEEGQSFGAETPAMRSAKAFLAGLPEREQKALPASQSSLARPINDETESMLDSVIDSLNERDVKLADIAAEQS